MPAFKEFGLPSGVEPIAGEPLRFFVASSSRLNVKHLVDLEECGFNGACGCENFQMKCLPELRRDRRENRARKLRRCQHIRRAFQFYGEFMARLLSRHLRGPVKPPKPTIEQKH